LTNKRTFVRTQLVARKKWANGTKATEAVVTAGVSALATGLSLTETFTQTHCDNCTATWVSNKG